MKKISYFLSILFFFSILSISNTSCSRGTGCPAYGTKATKKERRKGGKSNLFDKKTRKKLGATIKVKDAPDWVLGEEAWGA